MAVVEIQAEATDASLVGLECELMELQKMHVAVAVAVRISRLELEQNSVVVELQASRSFQNCKDCS